MNMQIDKHIIDKVNHEHSEVIHSSKQAIQHAIEAGKLLTKIKGMVEHGQFVSAINSYFEFSQPTAYRYIQCYVYSAKLSQMINLQEAYKLIETEEAKKKRAKEESQHAKFAYRKQYGEKPDTWERADDYAWEKYKQAEADRDARIAKAKQDMETSERTAKDNDNNYQQATDYLKDYIQTENLKQAQLSELNIVNQNGSIIDVIEHYLSGLDTDSQKIEECHNIIKYCKNVSVKLQEIK